MANLELAGALKRTGKGNADWYYGGGEEAWADLSSAYAGIPSAVRAGKTFGVYVGGVIEEYYWRDDTNIADGEEVQKGQDISGKANLNGGNSWTGNQNINGDVALTSPKQFGSVGYKFYARSKNPATDQSDFRYKTVPGDDTNVYFIRYAVGDDVTEHNVYRINKNGDFEFYVPIKGVDAVNADELVTKGQLDTKLDASSYSDRFKGKYTSLSALQTAHPTASAGDYAQVDAGSGSDVINYNYDVEDGWIEGGSGSGATDTDALPEGSVNLYWTNGRSIGALLTGYAKAIVSAAISATDSILIALGKLEKKVDDNTATLATKANLPDELVSGGGTSVSGSTVDIVAATWRVTGVIYSTSSTTSFTSIANSATGKQRYVAFYGNTSNAIVKVEGTEANIAIMPDKPANTALISYVLVGDAGIGSPGADLSGYALKADLGEKTDLITADKTTVVAGVNEVSQLANSLQSDQTVLTIYKISNFGTP